MLSWIGNRREQHIAIVSHSSYLGQFKDRKIGDETNELNDVFKVYEFKKIDSSNSKVEKRYVDAISETLNTIMQKDKKTIIMNM